MTQECKVLNLDNFDQENTSNMINEQLNQGWQLFSATPLFTKWKNTPVTLTVVLVREKEADKP